MQQQRHLSVSYGRSLVSFVLTCCLALGALVACSNLLSDFDFSQTPRPPIILPLHPAPGPASTS